MLWRRSLTALTSRVEATNSLLAGNGFTSSNLKFNRVSIPASIALGFTALIAVILASSCVREDDLTADQRIHQLSQQLMCPVCDGQTLDQSQAQLSEDMKTVIRQKIEDGDSNQQIRDYFVERYGEIVLASPDAGGFNLIAWVMPGVIFLGGALLVGNAFLNMRRRNRPNTDRSEVSTSDENELNALQTDSEMDEYLKRANREIASAIGETPPESQSQLETRDNQ